MKLAKETSFSSNVEEETSVIAVEPMNAAAPAKIATRSSRPIQRCIVIREPIPQEQQEKQTEAATSDENEDLEYKRKGKKLKKAPAEPSIDSTPLPLRRNMKEGTENKLREEAWLQKQRNIATGIGASEQRSSSISLEVDQHCVVIEDVNPPSKIRRIVIPFGKQGDMTKQLTAQSSSLPLVPSIQERSMVEIIEPAPERIEPERTLALVVEAEDAVDVSEPKTAHTSTPMPYAATTTTSQEIPATPVTAKTLFLLTFGP